MTQMYTSFKNSSIWFAIHHDSYLDTTQTTLVNICFEKKKFSNRNLAEKMARTSNIHISGLGPFIYVVDWTARTQHQHTSATAAQEYNRAPHDNVMIDSRRHKKFLYKCLAQQLPVTIDICSIFLRKLVNSLVLHESISSQKKR
jgi:hypothetical protein